MKKGLIFGLLVLVAFIGLTGFVMNMNYNNTQRQMRALYGARIQQVEASHDKMRKVIFQKAGISADYADRFERIFPALVAGRYQGNGDGSLMKFVTEANPSFDTSLYKDLMQSVEAERAAFLMVQNGAIDVEREYNSYLVTQPGAYFLSDTIQPVKYRVISSTFTKQVMATGTDDEVDLFPKAAPAPAAPSK